jgi:hypothetical protein
MKEYNVLKDFYDICTMKVGGHTPRENYLRLHSIRQFRGVARTIMTAARKIKFAKKCDDALVQELVLNREYWLKRDANKRFKELTGIETPLAEVIDKAANTKGVKSVRFNNWQRIAQLAQKTYKNGLFAVADLDKLVKMHEILQKEKSEQVSDTMRQRFADIKADAAVQYEGPDLDAKYLTRAAHGTLSSLWSTYSTLKSKVVGDVDCTDIDSKIKKLQEFGTFTLLSPGDRSVCKIDKYKQTSFKVKHELKSYTIRAYKGRYIDAAVKAIEQGEEVGDEFMAKLKEVDEYVHELDSGMHRSYAHAEGRALVTPELKAKVEELYGRLQTVKQDPLFIAAEERKERYNSLPDHKRKMAANVLIGRISRTIDDSMWKVINGTVGGYLDGYRHLVRKKNYEAKRPLKWADFTVKRFLGNGSSPNDGYRLADGSVREYKVHLQIKENLEKDLAGKPEELAECKERIERFEADVNKIMAELYQTTKL